MKNKRNLYSYSKSLWRRLYVKLLRACKQLYTYSVSVFLLYKYDEKRYAGTFLSETSNSNDNSTNYSVPRIIYVFWTGDNEMSNNRKRCLASIKSVAGIKVQLITTKNLEEYVLKENPLHPAYKYLSYVHRSDYLRSYFMNYYGGGYVDIKCIGRSWKSSFERLERTNHYLIGYPEKSFESTAYYDQENNNLKRDIYVYWRLLLGNGGYICRPRTKFTEEWLAEIHRRLDKYLPLLEKYPSHINPYLNHGTQYPIQWTEICGSIFHPLCLKYNDRLLRDSSLSPIMKEYR